MLRLRMCESASDRLREAKSQKALTWGFKGMHHTFLHSILPFLIGRVKKKRKKRKEKRVTRKCIQWGYMHLEMRPTGPLSFDCTVVWRTYPALKTWVFLVFSFPPRLPLHPPPAPLCFQIPSVPSSSDVQISCTPWVNYFVSLWIFLTSNKGINQTSTWERPCLILHLHGSTEALERYTQVLPLESSVSAGTATSSTFSSHLTLAVLNHDVTTHIW